MPIYAIEEEAKQQGLSYDLITLNREKLIKGRVIYMDRKSERMNERGHDWEYSFCELL